MKSHDSQMEASPKVESPTDGPVTGGSRFLRACLRQPVDRTPVWFLRQAGRYMPEYQAVRRAHTLIEICKRPELAADVTITAAEKLGVDAAIIFADLLLPLEPMGLDFEFQAGEGPKVHRPLRSAAGHSCVTNGSHRRAGVCRGGDSPGGGALRRPHGDDRILWRTLYAGELHDRRWRLAKLH